MIGTARWPLAIDLGTTNTVAAVRVGTAAPVALALSTDGAGLPSSVFLSGSTVYTGQAAVDHAAEDPASFYHSPKRLLMQVPEGQMDALRPVFAALYREVYRRALGQHGPVPPTRVVLTCPAALSDRAQTMLADAAADAGVDASTVTVVPEPVAATAWYCRDVTVPDRLLIVDVGGGTCDTALVRFDSSGTPVLMATNGDNGLGGRTLDHRLAQEVATRVDGGSPEPETLAALDDPAAYRIVEQARETLSDQGSCTLDLRALFGDDGEMTWTREEFETVIAAETDRVGVVVRQTLSASGEQGLRPEICLTGGTALTPAVQREVSTFGDLRPVESPFTAVALGALLTVETTAPVASARDTMTLAPTGTGEDAGLRRKKARGVAVAVCVLALVAAGVLFLTHRNGDGEDATAAAVDGTGEVTDNFDPSPVTPVTLAADSPLLDSGDLDCAGVITPAVTALRQVQQTTGTPVASGFNGITRCTLGGLDDEGLRHVTLQTFRPNGFLDFNATRRSNSTITATPAGEDLPGWYRMREESEIAPRDQVFLYVRGQGWFVIHASSQESLDTDAAMTVARALAPVVAVKAE